MRKFFYGIAATLTILVLLGATGIVTGGWRMDDKLNCMWAKVTGANDACLMNARGVTDGSSNTTAGMVGYNDTINATVGTYNDTSWHDFSCKTLSPGRWLLYGGFHFNPYVTMGHNQEYALSYGGTQGTIKGSDYNHFDWPADSNRRTGTLLKFYSTASSVTVCLSGKTTPAKTIQYVGSLSVMFIP